MGLFICSKFSTMWTNFGAKKKKRKKGGGRSCVCM